MYNQTINAKNMMICRKKQESGFLMIFIAGLDFIIQSFPSCDIHSVHHHYPQELQEGDSFF